MTLTREAITRSVCDRVDLSKAESVKAVEAAFEIIKKSLESGEDVLITGFGKFCVKDKGKLRGRNPQTGEELVLPEGRVVTFKCGAVLRRKLNGGRVWSPDSADFLVVRFMPFVPYYIEDLPLQGIHPRSHINSPPNIFVNFV